MPPNIRGPLSISIALTPARGAGFTRTITLKAGEPCLIGRASKSTLKNLEARHNNALFDCPVISREHAELRAHLWDLVEDQVTITDKGSMHGTRVNGMKLGEGQQKTLRSGDIIQFGEKVTRGENTHDGVFVTFSHHQNFTQESNTLSAYTPATNTSGVYRYPYSSEDDSDYDDDRISIVSDKEVVAEVSSAKTTSEQAKGKLDSQELAVDLDKPDKSKRTVVQDSLDPQASVFLPESVPVVQRKAYCVDVDSDGDIMVAAQVPAHYNESLSRRRAVSYVSIEQDDEEQDELGYPNNDETEEVEDISESDASELDHYSQAENPDGEDDVNEFAHPSPSPARPKELSPELRSSGQSRPSDPFSPSSSYIQPAGSMMPPFPTYTYGPQTQPSLPATYPGMFNTYKPASFNNQLPFCQPLHNSDRFGAKSNTSATFPTTTGASRWDKQPSFYRDQPLHSLSDSHGMSREVYTLSGEPFGLSNPWEEVLDASSNTPHGAGNLFFPQPPKLAPATAPAPGRISIPDIVENEEEMAHDERSPSEYLKQKSFKSAETLSNGAKAMAERAMSPIATGGRSLPITTSKKRKADDEAPATSTSGFGEKSACPSFDDVFMASANVPVATEPLDTPHVVESAVEPSIPARKRVKTSTDPGPSTLASVASVAINIAKYATVASAGGAGMLAFLCSPASEKLLTWLS